MRSQIEPSLFIYWMCSFHRRPLLVLTDRFWKRIEGRMWRKQEFCYAVAGWRLDKDLWLSFQLQVSRRSAVHHLYIKVPLPFNALDKSAQMIISLTSQDCTGTNFWNQHCLMWAYMLQQSGGADNRQLTYIPWNDKIQWTLINTHRRLLTKAVSKDSSFPSTKPILETVVLHCPDIMVVLIQYNCFQKIWFLGSCIDDLLP